MSWKRKQKNRTENGPTWEGPNPGQGCNATHVARARRWWQNFARRTERRTGQTAYKKFKAGSRRVQPPIDEDSLKPQSTGHVWPYGPATHHEDCCELHETGGVGECDCKASDASDTEWGDCH